MTIQQVIAQEILQQINQTLSHKPNIPNKLKFKLNKWRINDNTPESPTQYEKISLTSVDYTDTGYLAQIFIDHQIRIHIQTNHMKRKQSTYELTDPQSIQKTIDQIEQFIKDTIATQNERSPQ